MTAPGPSSQRPPILRIIAYEAIKRRILKGGLLPGEVLSASEVDSVNRATAGHCGQIGGPNKQVVLRSAAAASMGRIEARSQHQREKETER